MLSSASMPPRPASARRWFVRGRVQGVGYRWFAQRAAASLGLSGYAGDLDDGRVEVYAVGPAAKLDKLAAMLYTGLRWADVRWESTGRVEPHAIIGLIRSTFGPGLRERRCPSF